jgi:hypothetical protein
MIFTKKKALDATQQAVSDIFDRIRAVYNLKTNAELERHFGLSAAYCSTTIKRGSVPFDLADRACREHNLSLDFVIYGIIPRQVDGNDLLAIKNGIRNAFYDMKDAGFISGDESMLDLFVKKNAEEIERSLLDYWATQAKLAG